MTVQSLCAETADLLRNIFHDGDSFWPDGDILSEERFFKEVGSEGMAPLLYRRLTKDKDYSSWPAELLSRLRNIAVQQAALELLLEIDLQKVLDGMAGIEVKPLLLKGAALSHTLYPEPGLRPRCDADLLIPPSARKKVAILMEQLGYKGLHEGAADYINSQMSYSRKGKRKYSFCYDIHWQVSNSNRDFSRKFGDDRLFSGSITIPSLGANARTLNNVDALLFACFHRAGHFSHSGDRLIWLYDIHLLCQALTEEQISTFYDKARELEIVTLCVDAITTAKSWFNTMLPPGLDLLFQSETGNESSTLYLQSGRMDGIKNHALLELKGMSSWQERIRFLLQNAFPPPKYMFWRYNRKQKSILPWLYCKRFVEGVYIFFRR